MIPGMISRVTEGPVVASASTLNLGEGEFFRVTGSTTINTINTPLGNMQSQMLWLVANDGPLTVGTTGNILVGVAMVQNRPISLVWIKSQQKWYIET